MVGDNGMAHPVGSVSALGVVLRSEGRDVDLKLEKMVHTP